MINFIAGVIVGFCVFYSGYVQYKDILRLLEAIKNERNTKEPEAFVTRTDRAFTNENAGDQENSSIVVPKTPQLVAWEEQEELRKMNLKPR